MRVAVPRAVAAAAVLAAAVTANIATAPSSVPAAGLGQPTASGRMLAGAGTAMTSPFDQVLAPATVMPAPTDPSPLTATGPATAGQPAGTPAVLRVPVTPAAGIASAALAAYRSAAARIARTDPGCGLRWPLLAAIGQVESGHGGGLLARDGTAVRPILGPVLDGGAGTAAISDTDGGRLDGDRGFDRAVGPMQFLPGTWATWAVDGNGDGRADPENVYDAALAAGHYLCAAGGALTTRSGQAAAVFSYNHAQWYVTLVLRLAAAYADGRATVVTTGYQQPPGSGGSVPTGPGRGTPPGTPPGPPPAPSPSEPTGGGPAPGPGPTGSPAPTGSPSPTATPTASPTPTGTATPTSSPTPTGAPTPTSSPTPAGSCPPVDSASPEPSPTGSSAQPVPTGSSVQPSVQPSAPPTGTPSGSPSATPTGPTGPHPCPPCPGESPTPTPTPTPTGTPTATPTPTPAPTSDPVPGPTGPTVSPSTSPAPTGPVCPSSPAPRLPVPSPTTATPR